MTRDSLTAAEFLLRGCVQGIGVRPAIARLALELGLRGHVANGAEGVTVHVEGTTSQLTAFDVQLPASLPPGTAVRRIDRRPVAALGSKDFSIETGSSSGPVATTVPLDRAVCEECLLEVADARNRRAGYAFTSCTNCGPRYSIIETMPYERGPTAMGAFTQCSVCVAEYAAPADRRFHAQTNACPRCGPQLRPTHPSPIRGGMGDATLCMDEAADVLQLGGIVALKGIGGFQLVCDATNDDAVQRLRERKHRPAKPLAVMVDPRQLSCASPEDLAAIQSPAGPIVLVGIEATAGFCFADPNERPWRAGGRQPPDTVSPLTGPRADAARLASPIAVKTAGSLAPQVTPGLDTFGVMRPTTPLHALLLQAVGRPLVVTSGNVDGEPLEYAGDSARIALGEVADLFIDHDREIVRPIDDSVVRCIASRQVTIRAGRGLAPLPLDLESPVHILAVGGHQKAAIALSNGRQAVLGPHIGDLDTTAARERFVLQTQALLQLYGAKPELIVHDLHPDYFTSRWVAALGIPTLAVQHHHAHVVAGMLEHGWLDREVLGVAMDGTGLGSDGTIWGGEFLRASAVGFERVGSLRPFPLLGGERAIHEPWRVALSLIAEACGEGTAANVLATFVEEQRLARVLPALRYGNHPRTTSLGRLFDGVAAIVLGVADSSFEGHPAMMLEAACDRSINESYSVTICEEQGLLRLDWRPLVAAVVEDVRCGVPAGRVAMQFHRAVAAAVQVICDRYVDLPVVLAGGCFQNRVLTELIAERLTQRKSPLGLPGRIPPNDGGLAAGQLAIAASRLTQLIKTDRT